VDWIRLASHKDKRRVVVSKIVGLELTQNAGSFLLGGGVLASQEGLCCMVLDGNELHAMIDRVSGFSLLFPQFFTCGESQSPKRRVSGMFCNDTVDKVQLKCRNNSDY
jgi:hypothetical protein